MKKENREAFSLFWKSIFIGSSIVIPGISAGTIAFLFGIYDLILKSITQLLSKKFWGSFWVLFWVGLGIVAGLVFFVILMTQVVFPSVNLTIFTFSLFSGFILGSVVFIRRMVPKKISFPHKLLAWLFLLAGFALILTIFLYSPNKEGLTQAYSATQLSEPSFLITLAGAHFMAGGFMLMPGISGSAILLSWGLYAPTLAILKQILLLPIAIIALGNLVGIFFWAGFIHYLLKRHTVITLFLIMGMILGSTVQVFSQALALTNIASLGSLWVVLGFVVGMGGSLYLNKISPQKG